MKEPTYRVFLLRHGLSEGNENGFLQGQHDSPLTEEGKSQAHLLADRWEADSFRFNHILSSPLVRARDTAEIIASRIGIPVEMDPLLMERDIGSLAGAPVGGNEELISRTEFTSIYRFFGGEGEGDWQLFLRAGQVLFNLLQRESGSYLLVSHGGLINQLTHAILGLTPQARRQGVRFRMGNTGYSHFNYHLEDHAWDVITINNLDHLRKSSQSTGD